MLNKATMLKDYTLCSLAEETGKIKDFYLDDRQEATRFLHPRGHSDTIISMKRLNTMTRYLLVWIIVAVLGLHTVSLAGTKDADVLVTDILDGVIPLTGLAVAYFKDDTEGEKQWLRNISVNQGLTWMLWPIFNQTSLGERPNGDTHNSFPSGHVSLAMSGATFLDRRYGWSWGIPAYAASAYIAYVRVDEDKHHWRDVIASGVMSYGVAMLFVTPENATYLAPVVGPDFLGLRWGRSF